MVVVTAISVIVGLSQLGLFWVQLSLIHKSMDYTRKAADAAKDAAEAGIRQAISAEYTIVKVQRPYVYIF